MPVDPERLTEWLSEAPGSPVSTARKLTLLTPDGDVVTGYQGSVLTPGSRAVEGYVPHWATCPQASRFRR